MKEVERPAAVLVTALDHGFDSLTNAAVGFNSRIPQIIESAQDIVVPKSWEREAHPAFVDDFAGAERAEHAALEQIVFAALAGLRERRRFAPSAFVGEQSLEHADGGMEGRAAAFRTFWRRFHCFAVPAAIFELLAQELIGQPAIWLIEICANGEDSAVDAGLRFPVKERAVVERLKHEPFIDAIDHFAGVLASGVKTEVHQHNETVEGDK